jgi:hypothetical protein
MKAHVSIWITELWFKTILDRYAKMSKTEIQLASSHLNSENQLQNKEPF